MTNTPTCTRLTLFVLSLLPLLLLSLLIWPTTAAGATLTRSQAESTSVVTAPASCMNTDNGITHKCTVCQGCHTPGADPKTEQSSAASATNPVPLTPTTSGSDSTIDNIRFAHHHEAVDFVMPDPADCGSCGGGMSSPSATLPRLSIDRRHRWRYMYFTGSFGPGVFHQYDMLLRLFPNPTGSDSAQIFDPRNRVRHVIKELDPTGQPGVMRHQFNRPSAYQQLLLTEADGTTVVGQIADAAKAVLSTHNGLTYTFEVIDTGSVASPSCWGRLTGMQDRNGNGITIAYQYAADATDIDLGGDRANLWRIASVTDAYGNTATYHYDTDIRLGGRYLVERITVPVGAGTRDIHYSYNSNGMVGLSGVVLADGSTSTFTATDSTGPSGNRIITYQEAGAQGTHRRKSVYFTPSAYTDPDGTVYPTVPGMARMVVNDLDEVVYALLADPANNSAMYAYQGSGRLMTLSWISEHQHRATYARQWHIDPVTDLPVITGGEDTRASYSGFLSHNRISKHTDGLGRTTAHAIDIYTGASSAITHPDTTVEQWQYNSFKQPTRHVDELGRVTTWTYDAQGNKLTQTVGQALDGGSGGVIPTADTATYSWQYNALGQCTHAFDPLYNPANPDLHVTEYFYSPTGDPNNIGGGSGGHGEGYLVKILEAADTPGGPRAATEHTYDPSGRIVMTEDPTGRQTTFTYDDRNRLIARGYYDGSTETWDYHDPSDLGHDPTFTNLLASHTDRNGNRTDYTYDTAGRQLTVTTAANDPAIAAVTTTTYLEGTSKIASVTRLGETTTYTYDYRQRVIATTRQTDATGGALTTTTTYDPDTDRILARQRDVDAA